jgi:geranylgeranyl diphosphate synthase, type II
LNEFADYLHRRKSLIDHELPKTISSLQVPSVLKESMNYSLNAGGKRLRPILLLAVMESFNKDFKLGLQAACAVEMIHTYSLIHDDLPAMDNDDLRRGKPTNHKVFGDAIAILAGDALLTHSFHVIASMDYISSDVKIKLIQLLSEASGAEGMVGGQTADIEAENKIVTVGELEHIHRNKTGRLLAFSVLAGALLCNASEEQLKALEDYAFHIGLAFQIRDDILDIEGDENKLGKRVGSDTINQKSTYPQLLSMDGAKKKLMDHIERAKGELAKAKINDGLLMQLTDYIVKRDY